MVKNSKKIAGKRNRFNLVIRDRVILLVMNDCIVEEGCCKRLQGVLVKGGSDARVLKSDKQTALR